MSKDNGGPAFPTDNEAQVGPSAYHFEGMTLRDYFAAEAMGASLAAGNDKQMRGYAGWRDEFARESYLFADAMLKARKT